MSKGKAIALGALVIGSFDIVFAIVFWLPRGVAPIRIFQSIAAGLLGKASFSGGLRSAVLGGVLHLVISAGIVTVYLLASRWLPILVRHPFVCGVPYGIMVYGFMNYVVIPLSATARGRFLASWVIASIVVHAFLIGIPAALFARAAARE